MNLIATYTREQALALAREAISKNPAAVLNLTRMSMEDAGERTLFRSLPTLDDAYCLAGHELRRATFHDDRIPDDVRAYVGALMRWTQ